MDWIVNDSDDEGGSLELPTNAALPELPLAMADSTISEFTPHPSGSLAPYDPSSISNFTEKESPKGNPDVISGSSSALPIIQETNHDTSVDPANNAYAGFSSESAIADAYNLVADSIVFSSGVAESAKMRRRKRTDQTNSEVSLPSDTPKSASKRNKKKKAVEESSWPSEIMIELPSNNDNSGSGSGSVLSSLTTEPMSSIMQDKTSSSRVPSLPDSTVDAVSIPPLSGLLAGTSPLDHERNDSGATTTSSNSGKRNRKRRIIEDDDDFFPDSATSLFSKPSTSSPAMNDTDSRSSKKQRKVNADEAVVVNEESAKSTVEPNLGFKESNSSEAGSAKRKKGGKKNDVEQVYKSRDTVDESEDELLLMPAPKQGSRASPVLASGNPPDSPYVVIPIKPIRLRLPEPEESNNHIPELDAAATADPLSIDQTAVPSTSSVTPQDNSKKTSKAKRAKPSKAKARGKRKIIEDEEVQELGISEEAANDVQEKVSEVSAVKSKGKEKEIEIVPVDNSNEEQILAKDRPQRGSRKEPKGRKKTIMSSDDEEPEPRSSAPKSTSYVEREKSKEIHEEADKESKDVPTNSPSSPVQKAQPLEHAHNSRNPETSPKASRKSNPRPRDSISHTLPNRRESMSVLIRRASSKVQSPFSSPIPSRVHSPLAKSSRSTLSRIAPLHPNRRTPPPPPPRPPPPKKSKKMIEMEERWEEELAETVDGWSCMTDEERAALRRAKRDQELGYDD